MMVATEDREKPRHSLPFACIRFHQLIFAYIQFSFIRSSLRPPTLWASSVISRGFRHFRSGSCRSASKLEALIEQLINPDIASKLLWQRISGRESSPTDLLRSIRIGFPDPRNRLRIGFRHLLKGGDSSISLYMSKFGVLLHHCDSQICELILPPEWILVVIQSQRRWSAS